MWKDGPTIYKYINDFIKKELDDYLHKDAATADILLKKIQESERERKAIAGVTKKSREMAKKISLHNSKLRDCRVHFNDARAPKDNDRREESSLFITEGLSASGSITKIRDVETQGVFSLRGKPLNTYGLDPKKVYANEEFSLLQAALNIDDGIDGLRYNKVIVATGGKSYPLTGSTGDGYAWAQELGHKVTPLRASLVPLVCPGKTCPRLQGLPLKNVTLTIFENNKKLYEGFGEMLFTHFGISGPLVLSASSHMRKWDKATYRAEIDLKPALDEAVLDKRILSDFSQELNTDFRNSLGGLLPRKLIPIVVERTEIDPHQKVNAITKKQRQKLVQELKHFALDITQPGPIEDAIITSGGVSVKDIVPKTMESKKVPNLYFAGEIMDVDAYTGGFNLQIAWSTGYLAGLHAGSDRA